MIGQACRPFAHRHSFQLGDPHGRPCLVRYRRITRHWRGDRNCDISCRRQLVATARTLQGLEHLGAGDNLLPVVLDVTEEAQARDAVHAALERFGHVDILVNNAGICLLGAVEESSAEEVERLYRTNVFGLLNVTRALLPTMRRRRAGHIINISSVAGYSAYAGFGIYSSTKFAVEGLTEVKQPEHLQLCVWILAAMPVHCTGNAVGSRFHFGLVSSSAIASIVQ